MQYQALAEVVGRWPYGVDVRRPAFDTKKLADSHCLHGGLPRHQRCCNGRCANRFLMSLPNARRLLVAPTESEIKNLSMTSFWNFVLLNLLVQKKHDQLWSEPNLHHLYGRYGGTMVDHRVTKMDYRFLNTLDSIGNSRGLNLTVL